MSRHEPREPYLGAPDVSRYRRSAGWQPLHHAYRERLPVHIYLRDGGRVTAPVYAIGTEADQVELGTVEARFWVPWESVLSVVVITPEG